VETLDFESGRWKDDITQNMTLPAIYGDTVQKHGHLLHAAIPDLVVWDHPTDGVPKVIGNKCWSLGFGHEKVTEVFQKQKFIVVGCQMPPLAEG